MSSLWSALIGALIVGALTIISTVVSNAYFYGRLVQRVEGQGKWLETVASDVKGHGERLAVVETTLKVTGKPNGKAAHV